MKKPYTTSELFEKIVSILKEKGFYPDLLDYDNSCSWKAVPIVTESWSTYFRLDFGGSEGIYLDVLLNGHISDPTKEEMVSIGTFKTLEESEEAMLKMSELQAHFIMELHDFANKNIDDFTWYGGDVSILENGKLTSYLSCGSLERAYEKAIQYNGTHADEGKVAIVRDNATRKWYYENKKEYKEEK